jgi:hypothetical protein
MMVADGCKLISQISFSQALYQRALKVRSAVPHPKIMGIIRECGGKMHMSEGSGTPRLRL